MPLTQVSPQSTASELASSPTRKSTAEPTRASPTPEGQADFAELYRDVASGVVMIRASTCDAEGVGSGFLVADDMIVTAAHVVDDAVAVAVVQGDVVYQATVVGIDASNDVALLSTENELEGHVFEFADTVVGAGEPVAVIGHPLAEPLTITAGSVSRVDASLWPAFQLDASINPGNSGGPVVGSDGDVVGLVSSVDAEAVGLGYAIRGEVISERVADPALLTTPEPAPCDYPLGPVEAAEPDLPTTGPLDLAVVDAFALYFGGINSGDYQLAFDQLSPRLQGTMSVDAFADDMVTSYDFGFDLRSVQETTDGALAWLEFVSIQDPAFGPDGEGCTIWSLDYELVRSTEGWLLIDAAAGHGDTSGHVPCA